jgi:hypothetical protein
VRIQQFFTESRSGVPWDTNRDWVEGYLRARHRTEAADIGFAIVGEPDVQFYRPDARDGRRLPNVARVVSEVVEV